MEIKKAKRSDAPTAWTIRNTAIMSQCVEHYPIEAIKRWIDGVPSEEFFEMVEKDFYIAIDGDRPIGTGVIDINTGKIDAIFVHPSHMGKGVGKAMIQFLEALAMRNGLELISVESTLNAEPFYLACGFQGEKPSTYTSPSGVSLECVAMTKRLPPNKALPPMQKKPRG